MLGEKAKGEHHFSGDLRMRSELLAEGGQARGTARDSGAMTSIEFQAAFVPDGQPHSPNDRLFNPTQHSLTMSAVAKNAAKAAGRAASRLPDPHKRDEVLKKGAKRDPELYVRHSTSPKAPLAY